MGNSPKPRDVLLAQTSFDDTPTLFQPEEIAPDWRREWVGMPEYKMGNAEPVQKIVVSFASHEDVKRFCELLNIKVTQRTNSIWFPDSEDYIAPGYMRWVDE